ncbi:N(4)-(beta-N-acetylglucosaminyl)-L-asparaginase [Chryseobacterium sp. D764]|jgi:N4-(beta-N-acetylglucosaminyl)-L-asparaginase|uniref:isoaspartyl peptidase/L-asparaginase family protein n=1 Tax=unclassified Chryseobacterium TaxID=2593645 RepID=UPI000986A1FB|nr:MULTISPECIES: N(4)-(beta-N-acetylglucosaminyl)-L-asparaginase [unclassified Chryseobacterium]QXU49368.1 N(4)-(beta-N-acetylglucosaminyl)-L-asparaginase [Chryseobacterium sp. D764]CAD0224980.1 N(4)-(Beta-N-acetylglucosaminyl)-L-asparaginase [Chryseobacterium sp. JV274]
MNNNRRSFIKKLGIATAALAVNPLDLMAAELPEPIVTAVNKPIVLSTWNFGLKANEEAWTILGKGGKALDAVEKGVRLVELDPKERSVGYGGRPDRDGRVTLDACIMDENYNIGSVACLEHVKNPISVARAVMEKTPHVMLVGDGALQFALSQGFKKENLLTPESEKEWKEWLKTSQYKPIANIENHDTIGMIALDAQGNLSGACTTSGMAFKMHGRVGDSPIIGAGLFVDNEVGAATATGHGEEVIRTVGTHLVVELMRQGRNPQEACKEAVDRIVKIAQRRNKNLKDIQVGFIAINKQGEYGSYCIQDGFNFAVYDQKGNRLEKPEFALK